MSKKLKALIMIICATPLIVLIGCSAVMDIVTYCPIDPLIVEYTGESPVSHMPFTSLWDSKRLNRALDFRHLEYQIVIERMGQDDSLKYDYMKDIQNRHEAGAKEFQDIVFKPDGPIGLIATTLFGGTIGALFIKRPGDKSKKELEHPVNVTNNIT